MYQGVEQYYEKLIMLVKKELDLYTRYAVRLREDGGIRHIYNTKIFKEELANILEDDFACMDRKAYETERNLLFGEWKRFHEEAFRSMKQGIMLPFAYMLEKFGLTEFERYMACLSFAPELNREFERMYCYLQDDYALKYPTLDLCIKMFSMDPLIQKKLIHQVFARKDLLKCVFREDSKNQESGLSWKLKLRSSVIDYVFFYEEDLFGRKAQYYLSVASEEKDREYNVNLKLEKRLEQRLQGESAQRKQMLILAGAAGSGKKMQVKLAARAVGRNVLFFDLRDIRQRNAEQRREDILDAVARAVLDQAYLCFCHLEAMKTGDTWERAFVNEILNSAFTLFHTVFLTTETEYQQGERHPSGCDVQQFVLKVPETSQRIRLWREFLKEKVNRDEIPVETLAAQFDFTPGMIEEAVDRAWKKGMAAGEKGLETSRVYEACQQKITHRLGERASRVNAAYTWDDLVLEEDQKELLSQAIGQISCRYRVYEEWGFLSRLPYGRGVSMLFAGPPGTGKTMAAQVLANELNLELYKVDLSGVLSKYIGETQKNLREIFDEVRKSRSILFFDEADVLFGKRVNVTDSRDISANAQTAYLLQKMEEYDGITILATNLMQNFDDAYKRRMKYIIQFTFPRKEQRKQLWEKVFPKEMPVSDDIDTEYLAANFELSGASIKNIVLNAAFMAAAKQEIPGMKHIMVSLQQEYQKSGKTLGMAELKEYYIYKK